MHSIPLRHMLIAWLFFLEIFLLGTQKVFATAHCKTENFSEHNKEAPFLNIYSWFGNISPKILEKFTQETGIQVHFDVYDSDQILEAKMLAGNTGYDIVSPTVSPFFARQLSVGLYQTIDKTKLSNLKHLDSRLLKILQKVDLENAYGVPLLWGTTGFGYNVEKIKEILPEEAPFNSLDLVFNPTYVEKIAQCGFELIDIPEDTIESILVYLGYTYKTLDVENMKKVMGVLRSIRPYVKRLNSSPDRAIEHLVSGESCFVQSWSGEALRAREEAVKSGRDIKIGYMVPKEHAAIWIDMLVIPKNAPHPDNAHLFLNFIMRPEIAAENMQYVMQATANKTAQELLPSHLQEDDILNPPSEIFDRFTIHEPLSVRQERIQNRNWLLFKLRR